MNINELATVVKEQADRLFPRRTDASMFIKLYSEVGELTESPDSPSEVADIFIMMLDYAARKNIDIHQAVINKMAINEVRTWTETETGTMKHV